MSSKWHDFLCKITTAKHILKYALKKGACHEKNRWIQSGKKHNPKKRAFLQIYIYYIYKTYVYVCVYIYSTYILYIYTHSQYLRAENDSIIKSYENVGNKAKPLENWYRN